MMESLYLMPFAIFHIFPIRHGPGTSVFTALGCMDLRAPKLFAMLLEHHHPKKKDNSFFFQLCQEYLGPAFLVHQEDSFYLYMFHYFSIFCSGKVCYLHLSPVQAKPSPTEHGAIQPGKSSVLGRLDVSPASLASVPQCQSI